MAAALLPRGGTKAQVRSWARCWGVTLDVSQLDQPLTAAQLAAASPGPADPRSRRALEVAREGGTIRDVLARGVIDHHPTLVGPASATADFLHGVPDQYGLDSRLAAADPAR